MNKIEGLAFIYGSAFFTLTLKSLTFVATLLTVKTDGWLLLLSLGDSSVTTTVSIFCCAFLLSIESILRIGKLCFSRID